MRVMPSLWRAPLIWLTPLGLFLVACPAPDDDDTAEPDDPWIVEQDELPGAALSIWGTDSDDVWVAGSGGEVGEPLVLHRSGGDWEQLDTGEEGTAWWVVGDEESIWLVGGAGLMLRYDRASEAFTRLVTDTDATLFGAWLSPGGLLYAVGGTIGSSAAGPVLLRVDGDVVTEVVDLPAGITNDESFFKVWGAADDDLWVISDMGTALHFDGTDWARQILPENPRLVTIHGSGPGDLAVVGGSTRAKLLERTGVAWEDISPSAGQPLNGVYLTGDGGGFAAGFGNFMMERTDGTWTVTEGSVVAASDWHGVWIDEAGNPWLAGGNLLGLSRGMVARREPL